MLLIRLNGCQSYCQHFYKLMRFINQDSNTVVINNIFLILTESLLETICLISTHMGWALENNIFIVQTGCVGRIQLLSATVLEVFFPTEGEVNNQHFT